MYLQNILFVLSTGRDSECMVNPLLRYERVKAAFEGMVMVFDFRATENSEEEDLDLGTRSSRNLRCLES